MIIIVHQCGEARKRRLNSEKASLNFILDGMLGKLARWLRMMGHDVKYSTVLDDAELLSIAKKENRILLTRDLALYQHSAAKGIEAYYVEGNIEFERLTELSERFGIPLEIDLEKSRCPKCNTQLATVPKEEIADKVESVSMGLGFASGVAAAGAALAAPTGLGAVGVALGITSAPLIVTAAPVIGVAATVTGVVSGGAYFY